MRRRVILGVILCFAGCSEVPPPYPWQLPNGVPTPEVPAANPLTAEKIALGKRLFYDRRLSGNGQQSCSTCHLQAFAFAEPRAVSVGSTGSLLTRNAPALVNVAYNPTLTWSHPGLETLERQHLVPLFNDDPVELGAAGAEAEIIAALSEDAEYPALFSAAFPDEREPIDFHNVVRSIASFVRSLTSFDSAFDRYAYGGDDDALSESAKRGMELFFSERLECHHCHGGFNFTQSSTHDNQPVSPKPFHNNGLTSSPDRGLADHTGLTADRGKFRAPTLRNIAVTAPYLHNGSAATLEEVIDLYAEGGATPRAENRSALVQGFEITAEEKTDLLAFLDSLTDPAFLSNPDTADPFSEAAPES